tara:strand:- start:292 stop:501 length:210 start_codon:yes stop_codon:yes gene_type:complete
MFDISFKIKNYLFFIYREIKIVISFIIESNFEEMLKIFDNNEADLRHSKFDIKPFLEDSVKMILKKLFS